MGRDDFLRVRVGFVEDAFDFAADLDGGGFGEVLVLGSSRPRKMASSFLPKVTGPRSDMPHSQTMWRGHGRGSLDVVAGACRDLADEDLLGQAAAHQHGQHRLHVLYPLRAKAGRRIGMAGIESRPLAD